MTRAFAGSLIAAMLAAASAGCSAPAASEADAVVGDGTPSDADPAAHAAPADAATGPTYVFGFTDLRPEVDDPRMVDWVGDACGVTLVARVPSMPIDDPQLLPDFVVEFDAEGGEVRRWGKPSSAEIVAIVGERLHFRADHEGRARVFWTRPDGAVGLIDDALADPAKPPAAGFADGATVFDCPALPDFPNAGNVQCAEFTDAAGTRRRVAFDGACS